MSLFSNLFSREKKESLNKGLEKSKESFFGKLSKAVIGKSSVDDEVLDNLEEILVGSDVGIDTTLKIIARIQSRVARDKYVGTDELDRILREEVAALLAENPTSSAGTAELSAKPYVIMVVGVNGVGKTTTIGKLAAQFKKQGKSVVLGAADTFRAAAVDQLKLWGQRVDVPVIAKGMNTDPSAVAFETVKYGVENNADVIIVDTAGRLHTKVNLMAELSKIKRAIEKVLPAGPHEVLLVLDGSTGQNALVQAREFTKATN
jgi:fused signal recognition particle receptor